MRELIKNFVYAFLFLTLVTVVLTIISAITGEPYESSVAKFLLAVYAWKVVGEFRK